MDLGGTIGCWNEGVKSLLGYDEHEFVGMPCALLFTDEDQNAGVPRRELDEAIAAGEAEDVRWHVKKNGERCRVRALVTTVRDEHGQPCGFVKIVRDQADTMRAEGRLNESDERFAKVFRSSPTPVAIMRLPTGELTDLNEAFTRCFGRPHDDLRGMTLARLLPHDAGYVAKDILDDLHSGRPIRREATFHRTSDGTRYGTFAFEPVVIAGEQHAVMSMHDVTDRRAARDEVERQKAIVESILASLPGVFYMVEGNDSGRLVRWNDELERVTGYTAAELIGMRAVELVVEEDLGARDIVAGLAGRRVSVEARLRCKDGTLVPYLFTLHRAVLPDGRYVVGVGLSIEKQTRAQDALVRRARQQAAISGLAERLLETTEMREALERTIHVVGDVLGAANVHVLRLEDDELVVASASDVQVAQRRAEELAAGADDGLRAVIPAEDGRYGLIEVLPVSENDRDGDEGRFLDTIASLVGSAAERHRLHRRLAHAAEHDRLTGLPNRTVIEVQLENAIERAARVDGKVAVALLDLDRFKNVNDSLGHSAGDDLLARVADRLRESVRGMDTVARLGGDEFVIVLPEIVDEAEAAHVAERVLTSFEQPFVVGGRELTIATTLGIALFPDDGETVDALLRAADGAMYVGKTSGRGTYRFATAERGMKVGERLELERELREALTSGQLALAYQPQIALATDRVVVVEALVRWHHPTRGVLLPEAFLPLAHEIGLAVAIDEWSVREACARLDAFDQAFGHASTSPLRIAVNVAPRHLVQPSFPERMGVLAAEAGVSPTRIEIEVDESALLLDHEAVAHHLRGVVDRGFRLTLDDFGMTHAPVTLVRSLPFERLKIDETLVHDLLSGDRQTTPLAGILIELGSRLGLDVVAEGVETAGQRRAVERHGCGYAQGRLIADALSGEELASFLRSTA